MPSRQYGPNNRPPMGAFSTRRTGPAKGRNRLGPERDALLLAAQRLLTGSSHKISKEDLRNLGYTPISDEDQKEPPIIEGKGKYVVIPRVPYQGQWMSTGIRPVSLTNDTMDDSNNDAKDDPVDEMEADAGHTKAARAVGGQQLGSIFEFCCYKPNGCLCAEYLRPSQERRGRYTSSWLLYLLWDCQEKKYCTLTFRLTSGLRKKYRIDFYDSAEKALIAFNARYFEISGGMIWDGGWQRPANARELRDRQYRNRVKRYKEEQSP